METTATKAIAGLALLCALALCAFAAPSASALQTAFVCKEAKGKVGFEDSHCAKATEEEAKVDYVHESIKAGTEKKLTITNDETTVEPNSAVWPVFGFTLAGITVEIGCAEVTGSGSVTNKTGGSIEGNATIEYKDCTASKPITAEGKTKCKVKEPLVVKAKLANFESGEEMGLEFKPESGTVLGEVTIEENEGTSCAAKGTYKLEGSAKSRATSEGGAVFTFETGEKELKAGGNEAFLYSSIVTSMAGEGIQPAITLTTGE